MLERMLLSGQKLSGKTCGCAGNYLKAGGAYSGDKDGVKSLARSRPFSKMQEIFQTWMGQREAVIVDLILLVERRQIRNRER